MFQDYTPSLKKLELDNHKTIRRLLYHLDAPSNLFAVEGVLENYLFNICDRSLLTVFEAAYKKEAKILLSAVKNLGYEDNMRSRRNVSFKMLFAGYLEKNAIYVVLYLKDDRYQNALTILQQTVLYCRKWAPIKALDFKPADIVDFCRAVRVWTENKDAQLWLVDTFTNIELPLRKVLSRIELELERVRDGLSSKSIDSEKQAKSYENNLLNSLRLLRCAAGVQVTRRENQSVISWTPHSVRHSLGARGYSQISETSLLVVLAEEETEQAEDNLLLSALQMPDKKDHKDLKHANIELYEELEETDILITELTTAASYIQKYTDKRKGRDARHRIEKFNQYSPLSIRCLNQLECDKVWQFIRGFSDALANLEAELAILIMFFLSLPFKHLKNFTIYQDSRRKVNDAWGYCISSKAWIVPAYELHYKLPLIKTNSAYNLGGHYLLKSDSLILSKMHTIIGDTDKKTRKPFAGWNEEKPQYKDLQRTLKTVCTTLDINRVSNHLFNIAQNTIGKSASTFLFNRPSSGSFAELYYTTVSNEFLNKKYEQLLLSLDLKYKPKQYESSSDACNIYVGARYRPKMCFLRNVVRGMRNDIERLRKNLLSRDDCWIEFHNRYTAYCIFTQGFITGHRATIDPFLVDTNLIRDELIALFNDKRQHDNFNQRIVPIIQLAVDIADTYKEHMKSIEIKLIRVGLYKKRKSDQYNKQTTFLLVKNSQNKIDIEPSSPTNLKKYMSNLNIGDADNYHCDLPLNINRKLLRSSMIENDMDERFIDGFMGHAELGRVFWDRFSGLQFQHYQHAIREHLIRIAAALNLKAVKGMRE